MAEGADRTDGPQRGARLPRPRRELRTEMLDGQAPALIPMPRAVPVLERAPRAS